MELSLTVVASITIFFIGAGMGAYHTAQAKDNLRRRIEKLEELLQEEPETTEKAELYVINNRSVKAYHKAI